MNRVFITGVGCITPLGNNIETLWNSLINGVCGIGLITEIDRESLPVKIAAEVKDFRPEDFGIDKTMIRHNDTFALFALAAAAQAMQDSGLRVGEDIDPRRFGTAIGSGIGGIKTFEREHANKLQYGLRRISPLFIPEMISNIAGGNVAITYNAQGPNIPVVTACATGTHSVGEAYRLIHEGRADAVITGGTESAICEMAVGGFANMKALTTVRWQLPCRLMPAAGALSWEKDVVSWCWKAKPWLRNVGQRYMPKSAVTAIPAMPTTTQLPTPSAAVVPSRCDWRWKRLALKPMSACISTLTERVPPLTTKARPRASRLLSARMGLAKR